MYHHVLIALAIVVVAIVVVVVAIVVVAIAIVVVILYLGSPLLVSVAFVWEAMQ